jgi:hypothetical protein
MEASTLFAARGALTPMSRTARSRVTNGRMLSGVDGRSAEARRYRDLVSSFAADLGDPAKLSESVRTLVRQAAVNVVVSEKLQAAIVRGEIVDLEQATRVANVAARCLARLAALGRPPKPPTLAERLGMPQQNPTSVAGILARQDGSR